MTTASLPWSIKSYALNGPCGAALLDAHGNPVGMFADYRNAEYVLHSFELIKELEREVELAHIANEEEFTNLREQLRDLEEENKKLNERKDIHSGGSTKS